MKKVRRAEVTPGMVVAGLKVLRESGVLYGESSADHLVVRHILEAALSAPPWPKSKPLPWTATSTVCVTGAIRWHEVVPY